MPMMKSIGNIEQSSTYRKKLKCNSTSVQFIVQKFCLVLNFLFLFFSCVLESLHFVILIACSKTSLRCYCHSLKICEYLKQLTLYEAH